MFVFFAVFFFLWLICSLIALWLEKMLDMISVFLNLLRGGVKVADKEDVEFVSPHN